MSRRRSEAGEEKACRLEVGGAGEKNRSVALMGALGGGSPGGTGELGSLTQFLAGERV